MFFKNTWIRIRAAEVLCSNPASPAMLLMRGRIIGREGNLPPKQKNNIKNNCFLLKSQYVQKVPEEKSKCISCIGIRYIPQASHKHVTVTDNRRKIMNVPHMSKKGEGQSARNVMVQLKTWKEEIRQRWNTVVFENHNKLVFNIKTQQQGAHKHNKCLFLWCM